MAMHLNMSKNDFKMTISELILFQTILIMHLIPNIEDRHKIKKISWGNEWGLTGNTVGSEFTSGTKRAIKCMFHVLWWGVVIVILSSNKIKGRKSDPSEISGSFTKNLSK